MNAEPTRELTISSRADPAYAAAYRTLSLRVARSAKASAGTPVTPFLAGGVAMHFYTGSRMTDDIDAVFDRSDILQLANDGLITAAALRLRAEEALPGYVGNLVPLRTSIMLACRDIDALSGNTRP
jgi:hypothetical protein